jgi:hypothetical protein
VRTRALVWCFASTSLAILTSCSHSPTAPTATVAPPLSSASTPAQVADLLRWCWVNLSTAEYAQLFADNYQFQFATGDSAGNMYRTTPWARSDELLCSLHLFKGGIPNQPPATTITLDYTQDLDNAADPRPGKDPRWHRLLTAYVNLRVFLKDGGFEIRGPEYFYVVRGDSAQIPVDLLAQGAKADSSRWWLELWVDGSLSGALPPATAAHRPRPANTLPNHQTAWGDIKYFYR